MALARKLGKETAWEMDVEGWKQFSSTIMAGEGAILSDKKKILENPQFFNQLMEMSSELKK